MACRAVVRARHSKKCPRAKRFAVGRGGLVKAARWAGRRAGGRDLSQTGADGALGLGGTGTGTGTGTANCELGLLLDLDVPVLRLSLVCNDGLQVLALPSLLVAVAISGLGQPVLQEKVTKAGGVNADIAASNHLRQRLLGLPRHRLQETYISILYVLGVGEGLGAGVGEGDLAGVGALDLAGGRTPHHLAHGAEAAETALFLFAKSSGEQGVSAGRGIGPHTTEKED